MNQGSQFVRTTAHPAGDPWDFRSQTLYVRRTKSPCAREHIAAGMLSAKGPERDVASTRMLPATCMRRCAWVRGRTVHSEQEHKSWRAGVGYVLDGVRVHVRARARDNALYTVERATQSCVHAEHAEGTACACVYVRAHAGCTAPRKE